MYFHGQYMIAFSIWFIDLIVHQFNGILMGFNWKQIKGPVLSTSSQQTKLNTYSPMEKVEQVNTFSPMGSN